MTAGLELVHTLGIPLGRLVNAERPTGVAPRTLYGNRCGRRRDINTHEKRIGLCCLAWPRSTLHALHLPRVHAQLGYLSPTGCQKYVTMLFEQIDRRRQRLHDLSELTSPAPGRALTAAQVATVRTFWADLRTGWDQQLASLRHELLRLILDRVLVNAQSASVEATVVWRSVVEQHLWIERPLRQRGGKERWTEADHAWLREDYAASTVQDLEAQFPRRDYQAIRRQAESLGLKRPPRGRPKPKGRRWSDEEHAVLQAYAAGEMSTAELCGQLPGRSWDGIISQGRLLGLCHQQSQSVYYRVVDDAREIVDDRRLFEEGVVTIARELG